MFKKPGMVCYWCDWFNNDPLHFVHAALFELLTLAPFKLETIIWSFSMSRKLRKELEWAGLHVILCDPQCWGSSAFGDLPSQSPWMGSLWLGCAFWWGSHKFKYEPFSPAWSISVYRNVVCYFILSFPQLWGEGVLSIYETCTFSSFIF